jgi:hypothetical protein
LIIVATTRLLELLSPPRTVAKNFSIQEVWKRAWKIYPRTFFTTGEVHQEGWHYYTPKEEAKQQTKQIWKTSLGIVKAHHQTWANLPCSDAS